MFNSSNGLTVGIKLSSSTESTGVQTVSPLSMSYSVVTLVCLFVCSELDTRLSVLVWVIMLVSGAVVIATLRQTALLVLIGSAIVRLMVSVGLEPTLNLLGTINVRTCVQT